MFLRYRIEKLKQKVEVQKGLVDELRAVSARYGQSYYDDQVIEQHTKWLELNSRLKYLESKLDT